MVDPARAFGRPIVAKYGIPTESLANAAEVEESTDRAARWFDVPVSAVNLAVEFEKQLSA